MAGVADDGFLTLSSKRYASITQATRGFATSRLCCFSNLQDVVTLPARPKFEAFQPGRDIETDLALHAERLQRDRIAGAADQ